jgi:hypothetical protein
MKKTTSCIVLLTAVISDLFAGDSIFQINNPRKYSFIINVEIRNTGLQLTDLIVNLPIPSGRFDQDITNIQLSNSRELLANDHTTRISSFVFPDNRLPGKNETINATISYDATLYDVKTDFSKIKKIKPYNTQSDIYKKYTSDNLPLIDISNRELVTVSNSLWNESKGDIISYAELSYEYVAKNFKYLNPVTGLHELSKLLSDGGGDCGNLSSIYITLLRIKKIPARHVVAIRSSCDCYSCKNGNLPLT